MEAVYALLVTLVIAVLPTVLFLGLWHGLQYLRDDELIDRIQNDYDNSGSRPRFMGGDGPTTTSSGVRCPSCGTSNRHGMEYCQQCLDELPAVGS